MVHLTDVVGLAVTTTDGTSLGVVRDLVVRAGEPDAPVTRLLLGRPDEPTVGTPWSAIVTRTADGIVVADGRDLDPLADDLTIEVDDDELLLARDVLDTQVVDVPGRFLVRVADVQLAPDGKGRVGGDGEGGDGEGGAGRGDALRAVAIELTAGAKLNRVGFERLGGRRGQRTIPWGDIHLTSVRGRAAQLASHTPLLEVAPVELARVLPKLSPTHGGEVLRHLPADHLAATVNAIPQSQLRALVEGLPDDLVEPVVTSLTPSRAAAARRALQNLAARPRPRPS